MTTVKYFQNYIFKNSQATGNIVLRTAISEGEELTHPQLMWKAMPWNSMSGSTVAKTLRFQRRGPRFGPWSGN